MTTYTIFRAADDARNAESGLTQEQVVRRIYQHDGHGFYLTPTLENIEDVNGEIIGQRQRANSALGKEWDIYFNHSRNKSGYKNTYRSSFGETEEEAEKNFLLGAWKETRWDDTKWFVMTDEDFQKRYPLIDDETGEDFLE